MPPTDPLDLDALDRLYAECGDCAVVGLVHAYPYLRALVAQLTQERDAANLIAADLREERSRLFVECGKLREALQAIVPVEDSTMPPKGNLTVT